MGIVDSWTTRELLLAGANNDQVEDILRLVDSTIESCDDRWRFDEDNLSEAVSEIVIGQESLRRSIFSIVTTVLADNGYYKGKGKKPFRSVYYMSGN